MRGSFFSLNRKTNKISTFLWLKAFKKKAEYDLNHILPFLIKRILQYQNNPLDYHQATE